MVESAEITDYETLNSRSQVINNLWLRMQNTCRYIDLFRSGAQSQQVGELKSNLYHLLTNDYIPDSDKVLSLERMLERFISVESAKDSALHKEVLYLGSSMLGELSKPLHN